MNITITGNSATVRCNKRGALHCCWCSNISIYGITWDQCGGNKSAGFLCRNCSNIRFVKCIFQYSWIAVEFVEVTGNITFKYCQFSYHEPR